MPYIVTKVDNDWNRSDSRIVPVQELTSMNEEPLSLSRTAFLDVSVVEKFFNLASVAELLPRR